LGKRSREARSRGGIRKTFNSRERDKEGTTSGKTVSSPASVKQTRVGGLKYFERATWN